MMCFFTSRQFFGGNFRAVLRGNYNGFDALGSVADVFDDDLALAIGTKEIENALAAGSRETLHQLVRHHDRQRHQLGCFVARIAEHQPLVAGAPGVHTHRNIGRLRLDQIVHAAGIAIETIGRVVVSDIVDGASRDARNVHVRGGRDLAGNDASAGGDQHFARHTPGGIVRQDRVQHGVGNLIGNLIRMTFRDRFRGEKMSLIICQNCPPAVCYFTVACAGPSPRGRLRQRSTGRLER